jgi:hypothetical protein
MQTKEKIHKTRLLFTSIMKLIGECKLSLCTAWNFRGSEVIGQFIHKPRHNREVIVQLNAQVRWLEAIITSVGQDPTWVVAPWGWVSECMLRSLSENAETDENPLPLSGIEPGFRLSSPHLITLPNILQRLTSANGKITLSVYTHP